jgi:hypothetical protein
MDSAAARAYIATVARVFGLVAGSNGVFAGVGGLVEADLWLGGFAIGGAFVALPTFAVNRMLDSIGAGILDGKVDAVPLFDGSAPGKAMSDRSVRIDGRSLLLGMLFAILKALEMCSRSSRVLIAIVMMCVEKYPSSINKSCELFKKTRRIVESHGCENEESSQSCLTICSSGPHVRGRCG